MVSGGSQHQLKQTFRNRRPIMDYLLVDFNGCSIPIKDLVMWLGVARRGFYGRCVIGSLQKETDVTGGRPPKNV